MERNKFNVPTDQWDGLGENQETFNRICSRTIAKKDQYLGTLPADQRTVVAPLLNQVIFDTVDIAVQELHQV